MAQPDPYIGQEIGNYHIQQKIASGSFGTVYLASHLYLKQRTVVIKILHAVHLISDEQKEQFLQEAQILETLKGLANILPLLDVGIHGNVPYMIAEYAEQGSLRMYMRQRGTPLSLQETLTIIKDVGTGLQNAHNQEIVHRDLKPENILFNAKGEALLADFGLSTVLSTSSVIYTQVAGTPAYMAPEQFQGEVSKESDQYALACITYELLTGRKLFEAPDFVSMGYLQTTKAPTPPRQLNPQVPAFVEHALLKALSKERSERYTSVSAFVAALHNMTNDADGETLGQAPNLIPSPSTIAGMPTQLHYHSTPYNEPTLGARNSTAGSTDPPMPAYPGGPEPVWSPPGRPMSPYYTPPSNSSGQTAIIVTIVILVLLALGGGGWAVLANSGIIHFNHAANGNVASGKTSSATITITPTSKTVQDTFMMQGVTGHANPDNREVTVRQLTSTKTTTETVNATGQGQTAAVAATGTLMFRNASTSPITLAPTPITSSNGIQVIADQNVTIPAANTSTGTLGTAMVSAHAVSPGGSGNIAAGSINTTCCSQDNSITVRNPNAFTGGVDAKNYSFLQESDITPVTNAHQATLKSAAQNDIKGQMKSGEQLLGDINCNDPKTTADAPVGDHGIANAVTSAHVTVSVTCNAEVYDANAPQTIAQNALKQKAMKDPGAGYVLAGNIVTQTQAQTEPDGTITFSVTAKGIWYYQWTDANKQALRNAIKGMSKVQAQDVLNSYPGVGKATIDISNDGTVLPTDVNQITLDVKTVNGLSGGNSQTPTATVTV